MVSRLSEEAVENNKVLIEQLFETFPDSRKGRVLEMFAGPVGLEYFTAPASSRTEFHNAFPGGLADHSLRVTKNIRAMAKALGIDSFDIPTLNFVGLFHDFGKIGDGIEPGYLAQTSEWHIKKGMVYETNKACTYMPSSERGLYVLQRYNITLTTDEYLAIRLNDGQYDETNKRYAMKEPDLAVLVHMADRWACVQEKHLG